jgi:glycosyltransferase involved in cell wall biosynthesis
LTDSREKVLIITYYWPPSGGAGVQRWLKLTKYLPEYDITPVVLSVRPEQATYPVIDPSLEEEISPGLKVYKTPSREIYALYKFLNRKKNVPYGGFANQTTKGILKKINIWIRGNFFIPDPRKGWNKFAVKKGLEIINQENIAAIITTSPPHSTQLIGLLLKKWTGLPWIADFRDPWTDIYYYKDLMPSRFAHKKNLALEKEVIEKADRVILVSKDTRDLFLKKSDRLDPGHFHVIPNGYDEEDFIAVKPSEAQKFIITYTGTLTEKYGIGSLFQALRNMISDGQTNILIRLVGRVSPEVHRMASDLGIENYVEFIDYVPHSKSIEYLIHSTALLIAIPESGKDEVIIPGKIFEYLAARKPILLLGPPRGATANIIRKCRSGESFRPADHASIENYLTSLYLKWTKGEEIYSGNEEYRHYSRMHLAKRYAGIISGALNSEG